MYSVKYFVLFSSIGLRFFIANSQRKEVEQASFSLSFFIANSQSKEVEQASFSSDFDTADLTADERRIIKEWKPFQDPIRLVRERLQKKPRFSFRSANNARPILDQQDNEESVVQVETQTPNPNTDESEAPCASGSCKNSQEQMERKRVEWLKKTVLEKLKLVALPNVTTFLKILLNSPVMRALLKEYGIDQIRTHQLEDDFDDEIQSQKLISTACEGEQK